MAKLLMLMISLTSAIAVADRVNPAAAAPPPQQPGLMQRRVPVRPQPPPPRPSPEIGKLGRDVAGTYKCKGVQLRGDGSSLPMQATLVVKLELDDAWISAAFTEDKAGGVKLMEYRTFDAIAKQWTRVQLASTSGYVVETSLGERDGKWTWEGTATSPSGTQQQRDFEERDGKNLKLWGEAMMSGSWQKLYEATCAR